MDCEGSMGIKCIWSTIFTSMRWLWISDRENSHSAKVIWAHTPNGEKDYTGRCKCKYWTRLSKILEDGVHIRCPILRDCKPQILPSAHIFLPTRYTRNHGGLQITSIRDVGSYRTAKSDIGHYRGRVRCFRLDLNTFNRLIGLIRAFDRVNLA